MCTAQLQLCCVIPSHPWIENDHQPRLDKSKQTLTTVNQHGGHDVEEYEYVYYVCVCVCVTVLVVWMDVYRMECGCVDTEQLYKWMQAAE